MTKFRLKEQETQKVKTQNGELAGELGEFTLEQLLAVDKSKLTVLEISAIIDYSLEMDKKMKQMEKTIKKSKELLKEIAQEKGVSSIEGGNGYVNFGKRTVTNVTMTITEFAKFLKKIGKLDVFDHVVAVAMTPLKKYVDVHTLETEGVIEYKTDDYGTVSFKSK
jgi:hypothetical protein